MTAQTLSLPHGTGNGLQGHWLAPAWGMAALAGEVPLQVPGSAGSLSACRPRVATRTVGADASCVGVARGFANATLRRWDVAERGDDIVTVVSELLTNALRHALPSCGETWPPRRVRLGLLKPGHLVLCAVADPSAQAPVQREPDDLAESGHGLRVVGALSDAWGFTAPSRTGKVVWAMFSVPPR